MRRIAVAVRLRSLVSSASSIIPLADAGAAIRLADPAPAADVVPPHVPAPVRRSRDRARQPSRRRADPGSVQSRVVARHPGDRLPASAVVHREIGGGDPGRGSASWRRSSAPCSSTASAERPPPRSTTRSPIGSSKARSWCCSPKAPPATATACSRSARRWSAPRRRRWSIDCAMRVMLQPLAIAYTRRSGMPVTRRDRPFLAWYGDMELAPHLGAVPARRRRSTWRSRGASRSPSTATARRRPRLAEAAVREAVNAPLFSCSVKPRKEDRVPATTANSSS